MAQITLAIAAKERALAWRSLLMPPTQLHSLRQDLPRFNKSRVLHLRAFEGGETTFEFEITARIKPQCVIVDWDYYCPVIPHDIFEGAPSNPILL